MSFSQEIKKELCLNSYTHECELNILNSFLRNNYTINLNSDGETWEIKSQFSFIIKFIFNLLDNLYVVSKKIYFSDINKLNNRRTFLLEVNGNLNQIEKDLELSEKIKLNKIYHDKNKGLVIGAFLSGGSINSLDKKGYHVEIRSSNVEYLRTIQMALSFYNIPFSIIQKKNQYLLFAKKREYISDFLKLIGATAGFFEFEDTWIGRDMTSNLSRLNNLDISNIKKTTSVNIEQIKLIKEIIKDKKLYNKQTKKFKIYCEERINNNLLSLNELSDLIFKKHKIKISKGGLNHFARQVRELTKK